jgi:hypothetical protein
MKLSCCVVLGLAGAVAGDTLKSGLAKRPVRYSVDGRGRSS